MSAPFRFAPRPMASRPKRPLYERIEDTLITFFYVAGQALLLVGLVGLVWLLIVVMSGLLDASQQPEERCFATAWGTEYCRTQSHWGDA